MMVSENDFIGIVENPNDNNFDFYQDILSFDDPLEIAMTPFIDQTKLDNPNKETNIPIAIQTENHHYIALQNRILQLEARIHDLEFEKQSISAQNTNSTVSNSVFSMIQNNNNISDYKIKINDFSPEWDFVEGGSKMMICFSPNQLIPQEDQKNKLIVLFGDIEAKAICIQPGVIKCYGKK